MDNVDPLLRELLARADTYKARVPLTLYLPGGRVSGYAAEPSEFRSDNADRISERWEGLRSAFTMHQEHEGEYLHLDHARSWAGSEPLDHAYLRVRLADVIAWTIVTPRGDNWPVPDPIVGRPYR